LQKPFPAYEGQAPYVFVCYAHDDAALVYPEIVRLRNAGFNIWYDEGITPSSDWSEELAERIERCAVFLFFVTPNSVVSEHCRREVNFALDQPCAKLTVHLVATDIPSALKLTLSNRQAILKHEHSSAQYEQKLDSALMRVAAGRQMDEPEAAAPFAIGEWLVTPRTGELMRSDERRHLQPKTMDLLQYLAERPGELVGTDEILDHVWPGQYPSDESVYQYVGRLRKALDDDPKSPSYIETIPKQGYRLIAEVAPVSESNELPVVPKPTPKPPPTYPTKAIAGLAAIVVVGVLLWITLAPSSPQPVDSASATADQTSLVVIPFRNLTGAEEFEYLADGLSEALMYELRQVPDLRVAPSISAFHYKRVPTPLAEVGAALNVDHALEGSLRVFKDERVRVNFSLVDIHSGETLKDGEIERPLGNLLDLQETLGLAVLEALTLQLSPSVARSAAEAGTDSDEAYHLYLRALALLRDDTAESLDKAVTLLQSAIELDPNFVPAYEELPLALAQRAFRLNDFEQAEQELRDSLEELEERNIRTADGLRAFLNRDRVAEEAVSRRDIKLDPTDPAAIKGYALLLSFAGLFEAAYSYFRLGQQLDPFDPIFSEKSADMLFAMNRLDEALEEYGHCMRLAAEKTSCGSQAGLVLLAQGRLEEGVAQLTASGDKLWADCLVGELSSPCASEEAPTYSGYAAARFGDYDSAFEWFDRAADRASFSRVTQIRWQSLHNGVDLRGMPRYQTLLKRLGYDDEFKAHACEMAKELTPVTGIVVDCSAV
jgi:DNA-binding winged helix-turn-helix (wHTH) protein/TolB-like protein